MGTNYYARANICSCCSRYDEFHICKSMVTFQGYKRDPLWPDDPPVTPWGDITTWQQWRAALLTEGVEVWDEYRRQIDVETFIKDVEATNRADRSRQHEWMVRNGRPLDNDWLDAENFSFYGGEFS